MNQYQFETIFRDNESNKYMLLISKENIKSILQNVQMYEKYFNL